jgi:phosphoglycolate phosphatase
MIHLTTNRPQSGSQKIGFPEFVRRPVRPKLILFDFDGTLVDSFSATLAAGNRLAAVHGYRRLNQEEALALRSQGIRRILQETEIPLRRLPAWLRQMKKELHRETPAMKPHPGLNEMLAALTEREIPLGVVTSNDRENVRLFLGNQGWDNWFPWLETGSNLFGKSRLIRRVLERSGIAASDTVYVGDEERDVNAARKAGVCAVAVTWGFNDRTILSQSSPDHIVDRPEELLTLFLPGPAKL